MKKMKPIEMPVFVIEPGKNPRVDKLVYEYSDGQYEPAYEPLKALLGDCMIEHVKLAPGISLWCDEEGRLHDEAECSAIVNAPFYAGDIAGPLVLAIDTTEHPFDAFTKIDDDEARKVLAMRLLFTFGRTHIGPPPEDHVLAEPKITIGCMTCGEELIGNNGCSCDRKDDESKGGAA